MPLTRWEKRRVEDVLAAFLPTHTAGLPPFRSVDTAGFWRCLDTAAAPTFTPGLRGMLLLLQVWPVADRRFRRPFWALSADEREQFVTDLDQHPSYVARQLVATFKLLACFAWFDAPVSRARFL